MLALSFFRRQGEGGRPTYPQNFNIKTCKRHSRERPKGGNAVLYNLPNPGCWTEAVCKDNRRVTLEIKQGYLVLSLSPRVNLNMWKPLGWDMKSDDVPCSHPSITRVMCVPEAPTKE